MLEKLFFIKLIVLISKHLNENIKKKKRFDYNNLYKLIS